MFRKQQSGADSMPGRRDALHGPDQSHELRERQGMSDQVHESCPWTAVTLRSKPLTAALLGGGALLAAWGLTRRFAR
jgi:hypothetical protein